MEFFKSEVIFEEAPQKFIELLVDIIQRKEKSLNEIINKIDKNNLYAEIGGGNKINYISIGFFENYERENTTELAAFCPQIKIRHETEENRITVYFYKESHHILLKQERIMDGLSKIVEIGQLELRYILEEAHKLAFITG